jgi:hypothetical protein
MSESPSVYVVSWGGVLGEESFNDVALITRDKKAAIAVAKKFTPYNPYVALKVVRVICTPLDCVFSEGVANCDGEKVYVRKVCHSFIRNHCKIDVSKENKNKKKTVNITSITYDGVYTDRGHILTEEIDNVDLHIKNSKYARISLPKFFLFV